MSHTESNNEVTIHGIAVDIQAITAIAHSCRPELCRGGQCCCSHYEVTVSPERLEGMIGLLPQASNYAAHLDVEDDFFEETDDGLALGTDDDGLCQFAYQTSTGQTLCSVHSAAADLGLNPFTTKPKPCTLWPLMMSQTGQRRLSVMEDAFEFACNTKRDVKNTDSDALDSGIEEIILALLGEEFLASLTSEIKTRMCL